MCLIASGGLLEEANKIVGNTTHVALGVRGDDTKKALASFLCQIGLLENALSRIDVGKIKRCARMAGVENRC